MNHVEINRAIRQGRDKGRKWALILSIYMILSAGLLVLFPLWRPLYYATPVFYPLLGLRQGQALQPDQPLLPLLALCYVSLPLVGWLLLRAGSKAGLYLFRIPLIALLVLDGLVTGYFILLGGGAELIQEYGSFVLLLLPAALIPGAALYALYLWHPDGKQVEAVRKPPGPASWDDLKRPRTQTESDRARQEAQQKGERWVMGLSLYLLGTGLLYLLLPDFALLAYLCPISLLAEVILFGPFSPLMGTLLALVFAVQPALGWLLLRKDHPLGATLIRVWCFAAPIVTAFFLLLGLHVALSYDVGSFLGVNLLRIAWNIAFPILLLKKLSLWYPWHW